MNISEAKKEIRKLLSTDDVKLFLDCRPFLMLLSSEDMLEDNLQMSNEFYKTFKEKLNNSDKKQKYFLSIYKCLKQKKFCCTQRINNYASVSAEQSLLGYLTDGESHLKIYPEVKFN